MQLPLPDAHGLCKSGVAELFFVFLRLGSTSFGGPIAHLGYFREEFVLRRHWLDEPAYADLVALCQFLPGPASSQPRPTLAREQSVTRPSHAHARGTAAGRGGLHQLR